LCNYSLSENASLTLLPASSNPYLCAAIVLSMAFHFMILHVPFFANIFSVVPLNQEEWIGVLRVSTPITMIDEVLKLISRTWIDPPTTTEAMENIIIYDFSKKLDKEKKQE
jgi:Ca2+ transporting ATPase